jgi:cell fate regulator YaaT (PSP1 superfamily)
MKKKVVGLRFSPGGKIYDFDPQDFHLKLGDVAIAETSQGIETGQIIYINKEIETKKQKSPIKKILRKATKKDLEKIKKYESSKKETLETFKKKVEKYDLPMKGVSVDFAFSGEKITFSFVAKTRVDFRELVKDLSRHFKKQIRLRQIGPRDEAKIIGGFGKCGQPLCCVRFLDNLESVVMDMARDQDIVSKGSDKISGVCGRLMCCLAYEADQYTELGKNLPEVGSQVKTVKGAGEVLERNILKQTVNIKLESGAEVEMPVSEVKEVKK